MTDAFNTFGTEEPAPASSGIIAGVASARCTINPNDVRTSRSGWKIPSYDGSDTATAPTGCSTTLHPIRIPSYSYFYDHLQGQSATVVNTWTDFYTALISQGKTGRFRSAGDITINTVPAGLDSDTIQAVLFVNGNLTITASFTAVNPATANSFRGSLAFIVKGNISIDGGVKNIYGLYSADGSVNTAATGVTTNQLYVFGTLASGTLLDLNRDLGGTLNPTTPAEVLTFMPRYNFTLGDESLLGINPVYGWKEAGL